MLIILSDAKVHLTVRISTARHFMIFFPLTSEVDVLVNSERKGLGSWLSPPRLRTSRTMLSFLSCRKLPLLRVNS